MRLTLKGKLQFKEAKRMRHLRGAPTLTVSSPCPAPTLPSWIETGLVNCCLEMIARGKINPCLWIVHLSDTFCPNLKLLLVITWARETQQEPEMYTNLQTQRCQTQVWQLTPEQGATCSCKRLECENYPPPTLPFASTWLYFRFIPRGSAPPSPRCSPPSGSCPLDFPLCHILSSPLCPHSPQSSPPTPFL